MGYLTEKLNETKSLIKYVSYQIWAISFPHTRVIELRKPNLQWLGIFSCLLELQLSTHFSGRDKQEAKLWGKIVFNIWTQNCMHK